MTTILRRLCGLRFRSCRINCHKIISEREEGLWIMINKIKKIIKMPKTKRKAQLLPGICIMLLLCCTGCAQKKSGAVSGYADAKNGVAVVCEYVTLNGMEEGVAYGSGFFVGEEGKDPQYLVTNHHVIADYLYFGAGKQSSLTDDDGNSYVL